MIKTHKKTKIFYLGPKYSFHYFALEDFIKNYASVYFKEVEPKSSDSFDSIFESVKNGGVGIVAVNNTLGGKVFDNQVIIENNFEIVHKIDLKIDHCLLANGGVKYKDIKKILLHPQVKRQTSDFLSKQGWEEEVIKSTSYGALKLNKEKLNNTATIGSEKLAQFYNLSILKKGLSNNLKNITSFWIIKN